MLKHRKGCLICGEDLVYRELETLQCYYCQRYFDDYVKCAQEHHVFDECYSANADDAIEIYRRQLSSWTLMQKSLSHMIF